MIIDMVSLNLADLVVTYLAFLGPQKVLLAFAHIAQTLDKRSLRLVVAATAVTAACVGAACALTAPWLATFFHISASALDLAAGVLFFIYAVGLVLGVHFDPAESPHDASGSGSGDEDADPQHPLTTGFRAMLLPFVVSPLAVTAALQDSLTASDWGDRWAVAGAFVIVVLIDAVCAILFAPLLGRAHENVLEVFSRLLGILLAAVGVQLFIEGLTLLGVLHASH
jgi:multiple antibiotic resistance protein